MPLPPIFHMQVYDQPDQIYPTISKEQEQRIMATKSDPTIVVVAKVIKNTVQEGTTLDGKPFAYHKLTVTTGHGGHWDTVKALKDADAKTMKVFESAQPGDTIAFSGCFLDTFIYNGKACVDILALHANK